MKRRPSSPRSTRLAKKLSNFRKGNSGMLKGIAGVPLVFPEARKISLVKNKT